MTNSTTGAHEEDDHVAVVIVMAWSGRRSICERARACAGSRGAAVAVGGEPYQRAFHIVKQTRPGARGHTAAGDEHIVETGAAEPGSKQARGLAQPALGAVAHHRPADALGGGEAGADQGLSSSRGAGLDHHRAAGADGRLARRPGSPARFFRRSIGEGGGASARADTLMSVASPILGAQALAALGAAAGQHLLAVLGGHAQAEAVTALAHQAGRLKGPLHGMAPGRKSSGGG